MKRKSAIMVLVFVSAVLVPCFTQSFEYAAPEDGAEQVFPIGWSKDGSYLAYAWYGQAQMIVTGSRIGLCIQNLITDKVFIQDGMSWTTSTLGEEGPDEDAPQTAIAAWHRFYNTALEMLMVGGIERADIYGLMETPYVEGDTVHAEIHYSDSEPAYEIIAYSDNLGSKRISGGSFDETYGMEIAGYFVNPQGTRMAVVLKKVSYDLPYPDYEVIGCHLRAGFEK